MIPRPGGTDEKFLVRLKKDYPEFKIIHGARFKFRPPRTVMLDSSSENWQLLALHELGHAILGHRDFKTDIERVKMEMDAWEKARELAKKYEVEWDENLVQGKMDTYRNWLHQKSRCPRCGLTRFQAPYGDYICPRCQTK